MHLHDFLADYRESILAECSRLLESTPDSPAATGLTPELTIFYDEIVRAMKREAGQAETSPLPGGSEAAARHGGERQQEGFDVTRLAKDFGVISNSIGIVGASLGLSFDAKEYGVFNECLDAGIASALDRFARQTRESQEHEARERLAFLAHELRNALSAGEVAFSILRRGALNVRGHTGDVVERNHRRLRILIDQALLAARLQSSADPPPVPVDVAAVLSELEQAALVPRGVTLEIQVEKRLAVLADERLLASAVGNLLHNALKFTKPGLVVVRARREADSAVIEVEDSCGGLGPGDPEDLFQPYVQRSKDRTGLGLGLAITREAVQHMGGALDVRNLPGKGCVFAIRLRTKPTQ